MPVLYRHAGSARARNCGPQYLEFSLWLGARRYRLCDRHDL